MLREKLQTLTIATGLNWPIRWSLSLSESLLLVPTFFMAIAFELFGDVFGKQGILISLPSSLGTIPNFQPKLFPMELYLLWVGAITLAHAPRWPLRNLRNPLFFLTILILVYGIARAVPDVRANPLLVTRNLAFVWYLALPIMIALYPLPSLRWEHFFRFLYTVSFLYFSANLAYPLYVGDPGKIFWIIDFGLLLALAYGFCSAEKWTARVALLAIGFCLGLSYFSSVQRTTLVGLTLTAVLLLTSSLLFSGFFPPPRWRRVVWLTLGIAASVVSVAGVRAYERGSVASMVSEGTKAVTEADPKRRSETTAGGLERFRYFMWSDAWNLFKGSPVFGIGFRDPVVYRAYNAQGNFYDNTQGSFEQRSMHNLTGNSPPISGPHNSYLNAIARMGLFGLGLLVLHLWAAWQFLTRCYFACFFVLIWQMLYAFFNVSLEGPIRSFPILILTGVALRLAVEKQTAQDDQPNSKFEFGNRAKRATGRVGLVHVPYRYFGGEDRHVEVLNSAYQKIGFAPVKIPAEGASGDLLIGAARSLTFGSPVDWDRILHKERLDFLHLNNIHATLGPAFLRWIISRGIPTLMTVHNHRFYCTNGLALYGSEICKACRSKASLLRPILKNCNGSLPKSIYHSAALSEIRGENLLTRAVTKFLAPTPYIARELQISGVSPSKIHLFPHPVSVDQSAPSSPYTPSDVVFVGRLSAEKGITYLLEAAGLLPDVSFTIAGDGPLRESVEKAAAKLQNVNFLGNLEQEDALALMRASKVVCVPSVCHESFSLVAAEALSLGARLVVPDIQSFQHYVESPINAVPSIVTNPESLAYSIHTALALPRRTLAEVAELNKRFSLKSFEKRLLKVSTEIASQAEPACKG